jgi:hypothetical protein
MEFIVRKLTRYLRYLLNGTAAVLCVLIAAVWVASYFRCDAIEYFGGPVATPGGALPFERWHVRGLYSDGLVDIDCGIKWLTTYKSSSCTPYFARSGDFFPRNEMIWPWGQGHGVRWTYYFGRIVHEHKALGGVWFSDIDNESIAVVIPLWAMFLPPLLWTILVMRSYRRKRKRSRMGFCAKCGYDLRASNDHCPECGTPFVPSAKQAQAKEGVA